MKLPRLKIKDPKESALEDKISSGGARIAEYIELGYLYLNASKYDEQIALCEKTLPLAHTDGQKGELHYGKGVALYELGRADEAFSELEEAISLIQYITDSAVLLEIKGLSELYLTYSEDKGRAEKASKGAIEAFTRLIEGFPKFERSTNAHFMLERLYFDTGELEKALQISKKALEISRTEEERATALLCIAEDLRLMKEYDQAKAYYKEALGAALKTKTRLSEIYNGLAHSFEATGEIEEAIEAYLNALDKTVRLEPGSDYEDDYEEDGYDDGDAGDDDASTRHQGLPQGIIDYITSIEYRLGGLYEKTGDLRLSVYHYSNALDNIGEGATGYAEAKYSLGKSFFQLKKIVKAKEAFTEFMATGIATDEEIEQTTYHLAMIYDHQKEHSLIIETYEELLSMNHRYYEDAEVLYRLSIAYMHKDKKAKAIKNLSRVIANNLTTDKREIILYLISNLYLSFNQTQDCERFLSMLEEEFPNSTLASEIRAYLKIREQEDDEIDF